MLVRMKSARCCCDIVTQPQANFGKSWLSADMWSIKAIDGVYQTVFLGGELLREQSTSPTTGDVTDEMALIEMRFDGSAILPRDADHTFTTLYVRPMNRVGPSGDPPLFTDAFQQTCRILDVDLDDILPAGFGAGQFNHPDQAELLFDNRGTYDILGELPVANTSANDGTVTLDIQQAYLDFVARGHSRWYLLFRNTLVEYNQDCLLTGTQANIPPTFDEPILNPLVGGPVLLSQVTD